MRIVRQTPRWLSAALLAVLLLLIPGVVGVLAGLPLLFPSLGPTALLQAYEPTHASLRFRCVVLSHLVGLLSAAIVVWALGLAWAPSILAGGELGWQRLAAAAFAVLIATVLEGLLRAQHAPAASTTLLVALGAFQPTVRDAAVIATGVVLLALAGEAVRRLRGKQGGPVDSGTERAAANAGCAVEPR